MNTALQDLTTALRDIGRPIVTFATATDGAADRTPVKWAGTSVLNLKHLGDTEGNVTGELNEEYSHLTLPELTGPAKHRSFIAGEDPVLSVPIFYADPALRKIVSPTFNASGGFQRRRPVREMTVALFPEELFFNPAANDGAGAYQNLAFDGEDWTVGGAALTTRQQELLGLSMWFWRAYWTKAGPIFAHPDGGKAIQTVQLQAMTSDLPLEIIPDGERLYTLGDPADKGIDIYPAVGS